jgi:uncharacterized protein YbcV (DUF1398 family)
MSEKLSFIATSLSAGAMGHIAYMDFTQEYWQAGIWHAALAVGLLFVTFRLTFARTA